MEKEEEGVETGYLFTNAVDLGLFEGDLDVD